MRSRPDRARLPGRLLDAVGALSALLGAVIAVWWACTLTVGLALVTFETGSMTPAYPAGSVAVSVPEQIGDVRVGDVVTIDRGEGRLPITHRVVDVQHAGRDAVLRLKGDANRVDDPRPYVVSAVRRVVGAVPSPLLPLTWLARPAGSLVAVLLAGLTVGRAFWPRREPRSVRGRRVARPVEHGRRAVRPSVHGRRALRVP